MPQNMLDATLSEFDIQDMQHLHYSVQGFVYVCVLPVQSQHKLL